MKKEKKSFLLLSISHVAQNKSQLMEKGLMDQLLNILSSPNPSLVLKCLEVFDSMIGNLKKWKKNFQIFINRFSNIASFETLLVKYNIPKKLIEILQSKDSVDSKLQLKGLELLSKFNRKNFDLKAFKILIKKKILKTLSYVFNQGRFFKASTFPHF